MAFELQIPVNSVELFQTGARPDKVGNGLFVLQYFYNSSDIAYFTQTLPDGYDNSSDIECELQWSCQTSASQSNVTWQGQLSRRTFNGTAWSSTAGGTPASVSGPPSTTVGASATKTTINFTGGGLDGVQAGDLFRLAITRLNDSLVQTVSLKNIILRSS